jgi:hypothetical protein
MKRTHWLAGSLLISAVTACTTMGPMPATTGIAAVPSGRPGVELQAGAVPGYMISEGTQSNGHDGSTNGQLLGLIEPGRWLGTRGLIAGARETGRGGDASFEPFLGYRHRLDENFALAVVGHGATMGRRDGQASYSATRAGGELALDAQLVAPLPWLSIHTQAAVSATYLRARGMYCAGNDGYGVDCSEDGGNRLVDGTIRGVFAAATASLALDFGRMPSGPFHSARLALLGSAGEMPHLRDGVETSGVHYLSLGITMTLGMGER